MGADPNVIHPGTKQTALHVAAKCGSVQTVVALLNAGSDTEAKVCMTSTYVGVIPRPFRFFVNFPQVGKFS